jgi:hypothetical protein
VKDWQFVPTHSSSGSSRRDSFKEENTVNEDKTYLNVAATIITNLLELFGDDAGVKCKP